MGMGFAPTWLRQVSPPPLLHITTLTTARACVGVPSVVIAALCRPLMTQCAASCAVVSLRSIDWFLINRSHDGYSLLSPYRYCCYCCAATADDDDYYAVLVDWRPHLLTAVSGIVNGDTQANKKSEFLTPQRMTNPWIECRKIVAINYVCETCPHT